MSDIQKKQKKENVIILVIALVAISSIAAGVLAVADYVTQKPREQAVLQSTIKAFKQLQPNFNNDPDAGKVFVVSKDGKKWFILKKGESPDAYGKHVVTYYPAEKDGKLVSIFAKAVSPIGYAGNVTVLLAMKPNGQILNVVVTENNETPGLGTTVFTREIKKSIWGMFEGKYKKDKGLPPNHIMDFFNGKIYVSDKDYTVADKSNPDIIPESKWLVKKDGGDFRYVTGATITSRAVTYGVRKIVSAYFDTEKAVLKTFNPKNEPRMNPSSPRLRRASVNKH